MDSRLLKITNPSVLTPTENSGDLYRNLFNSMHDGVSVFEVRGNKIRALYLNERYFESVGYTMEQYLPFVDNVTVTLFEDDERRIFEQAAECLKNGKDLYCNVRGYRFDGSVGQFAVHAKAVDFIQSDHPVFVATLNDISDTNKMQNDLAVCRERCRILENICSTALFEYDRAEDIMVCTNVNSDDDGSGSTIENYTMYLRKCGYFHPDDIRYYCNRISKACRKELRGSMDIRIKKGKESDYQMYRINYSSIADSFGQISNVIGHMEKSSSLVGSYEEYCKNKDRSVIDKIKTVIAEKNTRCFMAIADIDDFTLLCERMGRETGNEVAEKVTEILRNSYDTEMTYNYAGDEFIVFMEDIYETQLYDMTEKFLSDAENITLSDGSNVRLTFGIGAAWTVNDDRVNMNDYYITAEKALLKAKNDEKNKMYVEKIIY